MLALSFAAVRCRRCPAMCCNAARLAVVIVSCETGWLSCRSSSGTRGCQPITTCMWTGGSRGARATRPAFGGALRALRDGDALVITVSDRLGRSTQNLFALAENLRGERCLTPGAEPRRGRREHSNSQWDRCCSPSWQPLRRWNSRLSESASLTRCRSGGQRTRTSAAGVSLSPTVKRERSPAD